MVQSVSVYSSDYVGEFAGSAIYCFQCVATLYNHVCVEVSCSLVR